MSKPIFSFLLFLFTFSLYAQENEVSNDITFAIEIAPELGPKSFNDDESGMIFSNKSGVGFTGNLIVTKYLFDNLYLKGGVGYKNKNFTTKIDGLIFGSCIDPILGVSSVMLESEVKQSSLHYIFIPVGIIYEIDNHFSLDIGVDYDFLVHEKILRNVNESAKDPVLLRIDSDNKKVLTSFFLGAQIKINDHIYFKPFTNTRYNNEITNNSSLSSFEFTGGLKAGWVF